FIGAARQGLEAGLARLMRLVDIAREQGCLSIFLDSGPLNWQFEVAAMAACRDMLPLDRWLIAKIAEKGAMAMARPTLDFVTSSCAPRPDGGRSGCPYETGVLLCRARLLHGSGIPPETRQEADRLTRPCHAAAQRTRATRYPLLQLANKEI